MNQDILRLPNAPYTVQVDTEDEHFELINVINVEMFPIMNWLRVTSKNEGKGEEFFYLNLNKVNYFAVVEKKEVEGDLKRGAPEKGVRRPPFGRG